MMSPVRLVSRPTEAEYEESSLQKIDPEAQKQKIRQIIDRQKSLFLSSSDSISSSCFSSFDSTRTFSMSSRSSSSSSMVELMKAGGVSLRKLFDMESTALDTELKDLGGSPVSKSVHFWGSDCDDDFIDTAASVSLSPVKPFRMSAEGFGSDSPVKFPLEYSFTEGGVGSPMLRSRWKLAREKLVKVPPEFRVWMTCRSGFRFRLRLRIRLRLRRLRVRILSGVF